MPRYTVGFSTAARQVLGRLDGSIRKRIMLRIEALEQEPRPSSCKKLSGSDELWRIRVGDYRVVYTIKDAELVVLVVRVGHRREVYR